VTLQELLAEVARRGIDLYPDGNLIRYRGPKTAVADLKAKLAANRRELLVLLRGERDCAMQDKALALLTGAYHPELTKAVTMIEHAFPGARLVGVRQPRPEPAAASHVDPRPSWTRSVTPDSRRPLVPPEVRTKIEAIECDARRMGWPPELLWNANFWDLPRGLAAVLDAEDEIDEVTPEYVVILKSRRELLRFRRHSLD